MGGPGPGPALRAQAQVGTVELVPEQGGANNDAYRLHVRRAGKRLSTIERGSITGYRHSAYTLTPDAQHLLSGGLNGGLTLYRLDGTPRATLVGHTGEVLAVAISGDGRWALSGSVDQTLALWSLADLPSTGHTTLRPTFTLFPAADGAWVAWTPEGFFAASENGKGARLVGYSLNQGVDALAHYVAVEQLYERFYRPDLLMAKLSGDPLHLLQQEGAGIRIDTVLPQSIPPQVSIVRPSANATIAQATVEVEILLTDQGSGVGKVELTLNGQTRGITYINSPPAVRGHTIPSVQRLPLIPGSNTITVVAYDQRNLVASVPATLAVSLVGSPLPSAGATPPDVSVTLPSPLTPPGRALTPLVTFLTPAADHSTVTQMSFEAQVQLTDQGGGIGKVLWSLNGKPVAATREVGRSKATQTGQRGVRVVTDPEARQQLRTQALRLTPGPNTITVVAYAREPEVPAAPVVRTVHLAATSPPTEASPPLPSTPAQPALSLLVVGINRYRDQGLQLNYAVQDGQGLVTALRQVAPPLVRTIRVTTLFDEQATTAELETAFARVAAEMSPHDVFVLYMAGHGLTLDGRYHFLPQELYYSHPDAVRQRAITQDHLQRWLAAIPARKSIVLLDTCESGSFSQSLATLPIRGIVAKTAIDRLSRATGRAAIVASTDSQGAFEGYEGHGVFTYVLLQALREADRVSGNRDGITGLFELAAYVSLRVPEITLQRFTVAQVPQVYMQGADFPVGVVPARHP